MTHEPRPTVQHGIAVYNGHGDVLGVGRREYWIKTAIGICDDEQWDRFVNLHGYKMLPVSIVPLVADAGEPPDIEWMLTIGFTISADGTEIVGHGLLLLDPGGTKTCADWHWYIYSEIHPQSIPSALCPRTRGAVLELLRVLGGMANG